MDPASLIAAAAAGTAAAAYLDAKYQISTDIRRLNIENYGERAGAEAVRKKRQSVFYPFEKLAQQQPNGRMIWSREAEFTFAESYHIVLQYANWLLSLGAKPNDAIGLYSMNSPDFVFVTIAMWSIGCFPAMLNFNLAGDGLKHCVEIAKLKLLIVEDDKQLIKRVEQSKPALEPLGVHTLVLDGATRQYAATFPETRPPDDYRDHCVGQYPSALIYTSGTSGLPKAFGFQTSRLYNDASKYKLLLNLTTEERRRDVWYICIPFFHATGFVTAIQAAATGITLAIGRKFSASQFWHDIRDSGATGFVYVGEMARYLLAAAPTPLDRSHRLRLMFGNGLRPEIWQRFQDRFGVSEVYEFFTSVEGMFTTSVYTRSGFGAKSVGHQGLLARLTTHNQFVPVALDPDTNDIYRDPETGFAKRVPYSEGGEIIIKMPDNRRDEWPGYYNDPEGSDVRFAADVFEKGDLYFRHGNALRRDEEGMWHFMDRLGDMFRWKGENVSTGEVQQAVNQAPGLGEVTVYGVEVPGHDGKCGCAAVALVGGKSPASYDWRRLAAHLRKKLPRYAVPVFVRVINTDSNAIGPHKDRNNKVLLRAEGASPAKFGSKVPNGGTDLLFWLRPGSDTYEPCEQKEWDTLVSGKTKL